MTINLEPTSVSIAELALRLLAVRGTSAYAAYLAAVDEIPEILVELNEELVALEHTLTVALLSLAVTGELLVKHLGVNDEIVLVNTASYNVDDWALLDRRRSSLTHTGVMVFVMTRDNFDQLMQAAPNLASWLGALVFLHASEAPHLANTRERRLRALRSWAQRSDEDIIHAATHGALPADPQYAEWLVLLGRGDLLDQPMK